MSEDEDPHQRPGAATPSAHPSVEQRGKSGPAAWLKSLVRAKPSNTNALREALEDYIEDLEESGDKISAGTHKELVTNVLKTHDLDVRDIMIPRADIIAIEENASFDDLKNLLRAHQYSRVPVYSQTLDDVIGTVHIKDVLACLLDGKPCAIKDLVREVNIISPSMSLIDLLQHMRQTKSHMALVVDEFGGIDGLVTINDVITAIVGEIEDEFDQDDEPEMIEKPDGSVIADGRTDIDDFEERYGEILSEEEREDIETLGGLAFELARHIPAKGEILTHSSGMTLEILEADSHRIRRLKIRNIPSKTSADTV